MDQATAHQNQKIQESLPSDRVSDRGPALTGFHGPALDGLAEDLRKPTKPILPELRTLILRLYAHWKPWEPKICGQCQWVVYTSASHLLY